MSTTTFPTLGPGQLTFGKSSTKDFSAAVKSIEITPELKDDGGIALLNGDTTYESDATFGTLTAEFYQDYTLDGLVNWTWQNAGTEQPFTFVPLTTGTTKVTGTVKIAPVKIGGAIKKANTTTLTFTIVKALPVMANKG